jgi:UDP-N-acetylglucosamine--N-acetylmuramyl-(pentapeptide) pyrophosphoryl-undecaprenol N-acetylglucosamine transferase
MSDGIEVRVLHQTGLEPPDAVASAYRRAAVPATVESFTGDMAHAYAEADLVISAAGAGTLAELAALGLPALVVPISDVADDHQLANARAFAEHTGATWVREAEWNDTAISESLNRTLGSADAWTAAARRMRAAGRADAAMAVAELLVAGRWSGLEPLTAAPRGSAKR